MLTDLQGGRTGAGEGGARPARDAGNRCPECGGRMVASATQASASFPSPPVQRRVCEKSGCSYSRLVRVEPGVTKIDDEPKAKGDR